MKTQTATDNAAEFRRLMAGIGLGSRSRADIEDLKALLTKAERAGDSELALAIVEAITSQSTEQPHGQ